LLSRFFVTD